MILALRKILAWHLMRLALRLHPNIAPELIGMVGDVVHGTVLPLMRERGISIPERPQP